MSKTTQTKAPVKAPSKAPVVEETPAVLESVTRDAVIDTLSELVPDITKTKIREIIKGFERIIRHEMGAIAIENKAGSKMLFAGGTLKVLFKKEHKSMNPKTGEEVTVPDRLSYKWSAAPINTDKVGVED